MQLVQRMPQPNPLCGCSLLTAWLSLRQNDRELREMHVRAYTHAKGKANSYEGILDMTKVHMEYLLRR